MQHRRNDAIVRERENDDLRINVVLKLELDMQTGEDAESAMMDAGGQRDALVCPRSLACLLAGLLLVCATQDADLHCLPYLR